jgi:hypothetical protein
MLHIVPYWLRQKELLALQAGSKVLWSKGEFVWGLLFH